MISSPTGRSCASASVNPNRSSKAPLSSTTRPSSSVMTRASCASSGTDSTDRLFAGLREHHPPHDKQLKPYPRRIIPSSDKTRTLRSGLRRRGCGKQRALADYTHRNDHVVPSMAIAPPAPSAPRGRLEDGWETPPIAFREARRRHWSAGGAATHVPTAVQSGMLSEARSNRSRFPYRSSQAVSPRSGSDDQTCTQKPSRPDPAVVSDSLQPPRRYGAVHRARRIRGRRNRTDPCRQHRAGRDNQQGDQGRSR